MKRYVLAVESALKERNWYTALALTLCLPDMCGWLEAPKVKGGEKRYAKWFERYMPDYRDCLSGSDCYALRCAYLHEGAESTERQRAADALHHFQFIASSKNFIAHRNAWASGRLQLDVTMFCTDMCNGVRQWLRDNQNNRAITELILNELLYVDDVELSGPPIVHG